MILSPVSHPGLLQASHLRAVIDAIMHAMDRIPAADRGQLPAQLTPRRLDSREDVEHWSRRLDIEEVRAQPVGRLLRELFSAALRRMDEIGPARSRPQA